MIAFSCDGCGRSFVVPEDRSGLRTRCKGCGAPLTVPTVGPVAPSRAPLRAEARPPRRKPRSRWVVGHDGIVAFIVGAVLAGIALAVPLLGFVVFTLMTVIHELGHVATAWLLGSPALPSFDLTYGGGFSRVLPRQPLLIAAGCVGFVSILWRVRADRPALTCWAVAAALYGVAVFTPLRNTLILSMGHGSELLFAGIFLYRALSGNQILRGEERPLYAALGLFVLVADARFAYSLITSADFREVYGDAKGGGHWMDFDQIATNLGWSLAGVARLFLITCVLTPLASFLAYRYHPK